MVDTWKWQEPNLRGPTPKNGKYWSLADPPTPLALIAERVAEGSVNIIIDNEFEALSINIPKEQAEALAAFLAKKETTSG